MQGKKVKEKLRTEIIEKHNNGETTTFLAKEYGVHRVTIGRILHSVGIETPLRKIALNEDYFSNIDTEDKAYWVGFISADGYISKTGTLWIGLKGEDKPHLEKFKKDVGSGHTVKERDIYLKTTGKYYPTAYLTFGCRKLTNDLINIGVGNKKSFTLEPCKFIPDDLLKHYWRGLVDGDGCIYKKDQTHFNTGLCGTKQIIDGYVDYIKKTLGDISLVVSSDPEKNNGNFYKVEFNSNITAKKVCSLLYENANIFLDRKKILAEDCIKNASCYPQLTDEKREQIVEDYYNGQTATQFEEKYELD